MLWDTCSRTAPDGAIVDVGPRGFAALAIFARPLALREAKRRGCALIMFLAHDMLVSGFYDQLSYQRVGVVDGCPAGSTAR